MLTHWFKKKLGLALGCVLGGSSMGGCIFPILVKTLVQRTRYEMHALLLCSLLTSFILSFQWTMRILGFVTLGLLIITNLVSSVRLASVLVLLIPAD